MRLPSDLCWKIEMLSPLLAASVLICLLVAAVLWLLPPPAGRGIETMFEKEGFLVSMYSVGTFCPGCSSSPPCTVEDVEDVGDVGRLLRISQQDSKTSCFSIDTTFLHHKLPVLVFGPTFSPASEENIGLMLDLNVLKSYVACQAVLDSGSVGRYNQDSLRHAKGITSETLNRDYTALLSQCKGSAKGVANKCGLSMAGCGYSGFTGTTEDHDYNFSGTPQDVPTWNGYVPQGWSLAYNANSQKLYSRDNWDLWLEDAHKVAMMTAAQAVPSPSCDSTVILSAGGQASRTNTCSDKWAYNKTGANGNSYRENEVDIFVPLEDAESCSPSAAFRQSWIDSIIGIFTNAQCVAKDPPRFYSTKGFSTCCNDDYLSEVVQRLVQKFNSAHGKDIKGYMLQTESPDAVFSQFLRNRRSALKMRRIY